MFNNTIKSKVMKHINNRIEEAQKAHDDKVAELAETARISKKLIDENVKVETENFTNELVSRIIGAANII